ncbi:MAG: toxin-antitoxin system HicB family antitoxin [Candidatus Freyarchaeota archaeon]
MVPSFYGEVNSSGTFNLRLDEELHKRICDLPVKVKPLTVFVSICCAKYLSYLTGIDL